jgi:hypothetical protein
MTTTWGEMWLSIERGKRRRGYSLLEVVLASAICAAALVPALAVMRDGILTTETIDTRHMLLLYGVEQMEEQLAIVAAGWTQGSTSGDYAAEGHPNIRFEVSRTDNAGSGGIADRLMVVTVVAYSDEDGDDALDAAEPQTTLTTKLSKLATYETLAGS